MRIIVSVLVSVLACFVVAAPRVSAQVAGDSIRIRIPPSSVWTHGRFVSRDGGQLMVSHAAGDQSYPLQSIGRLGVGLGVGLIELGVSPRHWKRVRVGLKPAT